MHLPVNVAVSSHYSLDGSSPTSSEAGQMATCTDRWLPKKDCSKILEGNSKLADSNGEFVWESRVWAGREEWVLLNRPCSRLTGCGSGKWDESCPRRDARSDCCKMAQLCYTDVPIQGHLSRIILVSHT